MQAKKTSNRSWGPELNRIYFLLLLFNQFSLYRSSALSCFFSLVFLLPFRVQDSKTFYFPFPMVRIDGNKSHKVHKSTIYNIPYTALLPIFAFSSSFRHFAIVIQCSKRNQLWKYKTFEQSFFCIKFECLIRCDVFMDHRKHNRNDNPFDSLTRKVDHNNIVSVNLLCWTNWATMKCKHYNIECHK